MIASGRSNASFRSKWTCSGSFGSARPGRPVVGAEPRRQHRRRRDRAAGELVGDRRRPRTAGCRSRPTSSRSRSSRARRGSRPSSSYWSTSITCVHVGGQLVASSRSACRSCDHSCVAERRRTRRSVKPGGAQQLVGVGDGRVAHFVRVRPARRSCPRTRARPGGTSPWSGCFASTNAPRATNCSSSTTSGIDQHRR